MVGGWCTERLPFFDRPQREQISSSSFCRLLALRVVGQHTEESSWSLLASGREESPECKQKPRNNVCSCASLPREKKTPKSCWQSSKRLVACWKKKSADWPPSGNLRGVTTKQQL